MKKEINLTPKQHQVLETLGDMLQRHNFQQIPVSDIYCNMTAVEQIVTPNWFDRTFNKLEELGLVKKDGMSYQIKGGYKKGEIVKTYCYNLTPLGLEYLGIEVDNDLVNLRQLEGTTFDVDEIICSMSDLTEEVIVSNSHVLSYFKGYGICLLYNVYYNYGDSPVYNVWVNENNMIIQVH